VYERTGGREGGREGGRFQYRWTGGAGAWTGPRSSRLAAAAGAWPQRRSRDSCGSDRHDGALCQEGGGEGRREGGREGGKGESQK